MGIHGKYRQKRRRPHHFLGVILSAALIIAAALLLRALPLAASGDAIAIEPLPTPAGSPSPAPILPLAPETAPPATPAYTDGLGVDADNAFTFAWISDTQHYSEEHPAIFYCMMRFLRDNAQRMNLRYIIHTGDLVQNYDDEGEWDVAEKAFSYVKRIPYGVLAGNHDANYGGGDFSFYAERFGERAMRARRYSSDYCLGFFEDNRGHYDLVDAGKLKFLFVYMSYAPDSKAVKWLNSAFTRYPDRIGVLCVHEYMDSKKARTDAGELLFERVVQRNPNVRLVLCGHRYNAGCVEERIDDDGDGAPDRIVYQLISNYQAAGNIGGSGYMLFLQVDPDAGEIRALSYSPWTGDRRFHDNEGAEDEKYRVDPDDEEYTVKLF